MYCQRCGRFVDGASSYCQNCGARVGNNYNTNPSDDRSSVGFSILGFFVPIVGLILYLIYEGEKPKRAKSAGKGALIGFITSIIISIITTILIAIFSASVFSNFTNVIESVIPEAFSVIEEETTDESLEKYVDISFGEFNVTNNGYITETSLDVTVKNKAHTRCTYYITIEAVDENGARIKTDTIYADRLGVGQEIYLKAFEYVGEDDLDKFQNATFRVMEIGMYD